MKSFKKIGVTLIACSLTLSVFAKDKPKKSYEEMVEELGGDAYYIDDPDCDKFDNNCHRIIPYDHETVWFWLDKSEKRKRRLRNLEKRNAYLSKNFPPASQFEVEKLEKHRRKIASTVEDHRKRAEQAGKKAEEMDGKLTSLRERQEKLQKEKDRLDGILRGLHAEHESVRQGDAGLMEDIEDLLKGNRIELKDSEKAALKKYVDHQQLLRKAIKDRKSLEGQIGSLAGDSRTLRAEAEYFTKQAEESAKGMEAAAKAYGDALGRLSSDKDKRKALVDAQAQNAKLSSAQKYAKDQMKKLKDKGQLAEFFMKDMDQFAKENKLSELETKFLLQEAENAIENSLLASFVNAQIAKMAKSICEDQAKCAAASNNPEKFLEEIQKTLGGKIKFCEPQ